MAVNLHLKYWRFGNNGGTESTHTWIGAQNATPPLKLDTTYLVRLGIQQTEATAAANLAQQFQCNPKGLGWQNMTTSSTYARTVTPTTYANNANSTNRLTGLTGSADASNANCTTDGSSGGTANDVPASGFSETVCAFQLRSADGLVCGDTVQFRCTVSGPTTTITYDVTPSALVLGPLLAVTETPVAARSFWPPVEQALDTTVEARATSEYAGSSVRVHCLADLEGHKLESGPSLSYETLEAVETPEAGLRFPPKLDSTAPSTASIAKAIFTPRLDAVAASTADCARVVFARRDYKNGFDVAIAATVAATKAIFAPVLAAVVNFDQAANLARRVLVFLTPEKTFATPTVSPSAGLRFPPRLSTTEAPEASLARMIFASVTLAAEAPTVADSKESGKLDAQVATTATLDATVLAFRSLDTTVSPVATLRAPVKLDATVAPEALLVGKGPGYEETLDATVAAVAGLLFPPKLDGQAANTGDLTRAVMAFRLLDATQAPVAYMRESKQLATTAATTADLAVQVVRHVTLDATADSGPGMIYPPKLDAVVTPDATLTETIPTTGVLLEATTAAVAGLLYPPKLDAEAASTADASKSALYHILLEAELGGTGGSGTPPAPDLHYGTFPFVEDVAHVVGAPPIPRVTPPQRAVAGLYCVSEDSRVTASAYAKSTPLVRVEAKAKLVIRATAACASEPSGTFMVGKTFVVAKAEAWSDGSQGGGSALADDSLRLLGMLT